MPIIDGVTEIILDIKYDTHEAFIFIFDTHKFYN